MLRKILLIFLILFILAPVQAKHRHHPDSAWNDWNFRISPYIWYIGFKGTIYRPPQPSNMPEPPPPKFEIDVSFKDIRHSIKFIAMLSGKYRGKKVVTMFNFSSLILESEVITPSELLFQDVILNLSFFAGDLDVGYRFIRKDKIQLDGLIGLKFIYFKIGGRSKILGHIPLEGERDHLLMDPVIGLNAIYRPHKRIELTAYGDFGAGLAGPDISYQAITGVRYLITRTFNMSLGYRIWGIKHDVSEAIFNGHVKGWIMKFGFQW